MHCSRCSASPNLSRQSLSKCSSCCGGLVRTTRKHLSAGTLAKPLRKHAKTARVNEDETVSDLVWVSISRIRKRRCPWCTAGLEKTTSKIQLPLCRPASLLRPCRAPRIHLQIKKRQKCSSSFIYKKHVFVFSSSPTWANPRVTLSKPAGKLEDARCTTRTLCFPHSDYLWCKCTSNIRCFPQGKLKQEPGERGCGNRLDNTITKESRKGHTPLAASGWLFYIYSKPKGIKRFSHKSNKTIFVWNPPVKIKMRTKLRLQKSRCLEMSNIT